jgi:hypothetical protein
MFISQNTSKLKTDLALRLGPLNQNPPATTMGTKDTMATMES